MISDAQLHSCFSDDEAKVVEEIFASGSRLPDSQCRELTEALERRLQTILHVVEAIETCPSVFSSQRFAGRERSLASLLHNLCNNEPYLREFRRPTRAVLGESFLLTKVNVFKAMIYLLKSFEREEMEPLIERIGATLEQLVYIRLAEELLFNSVSNAHNPVRVKQVAANLLLPLWEKPTHAPLGEFTALLLSAWRARRHVRETFGTLVGVHEVFSLLRADCESAFLDYFTRDRVSVDEGEAFREFLFGLSHEDLLKLREHMDQHDLAVVGPAEVWSILGQPPPRAGSRWTAETVYSSYRRRRIRADYRMIAQAPGPQKTAEGYLMGYYLRRQAVDDSASADDDTPTTHSADSAPPEPGTPRE